MAISKIIYKTSPEDTGTVWMDATPATASASDITAPKTAMLADGVMTTGTGSGGGETVIIEEQSVTTDAYTTPPYAEISSGVTAPQDGDVCTVVLSGTSYTVTAVDTGDGVMLGEVEGGMPSFANYPFNILFWEWDGEYGADLTTETAGTYTIKVTKGGGGSATLITKTINTNGIYNASADSADGYSEVTVSVPNTYTAGDEGKVVSSGALVSQTAATYTVNSVYDTTLIDEVTVNVSGGASPMTLLYSGEVQVNTSSTSETTVQAGVTVPFSTYVADRPRYAVFAEVYDKDGPRTGYFYKTIQSAFIATASGTPRTGVYGGSGSEGMTTVVYGVYCYFNFAGGSVDIRAKYNSTYGAINGTYVVKIYAVDLNAL